MARILCFLTTFVLAISFEGVQSWGWSYRNDNGPNFWSKVKSDCSGDVMLQSPIDIPKVSTGKRKYDKSMKDMLFINYDKEVKGEVKNNGNNVVFNITDTQKRYLRNGRLEIAAKYNPQEFHFHFGKTDDSESGHLFEGKKYPMELHIVHYKDEYGSMKKAMDYHDGIVIMVFFFEIGENNNNTIYENVTKFIAEVRFKDDKAEFDGFSLQDITNSDIKIAKDKGKHLHYFQYTGTLDTPPCYHVEWLVFKDPIKLTSFQLGLFRNLRRVKNRNIDIDKYDDYDKMAPNYRPIQDLGDRTVWESYDYSSSADRVVTDVQPWFSTFASTIIVSDKATSGALTTLACTDGTSASNTLALAGGDDYGAAAKFIFTAASGVLAKSSVVLDATTKANYLLTFTCVAGTHTATTTVTICVNNESNCPSSKASINNGELAGLIVPALLAIYRLS